MLNLKLYYNLTNPKEGFVQLVKRFLSLIMPLYCKIKDLDLQFNSFIKEINEANFNESSSFQSLIRFNDL